MYDQKTFPNVKPTARVFSFSVNFLRKNKPIRNSYSGYLRITIEYFSGIKNAVNEKTQVVHYTFYTFKYRPSLQYPYNLELLYIYSSRYQSIHLYYHMTSNWCRLLLFDQCKVSCQNIHCYICNKQLVYLCLQFHHNLFWLVQRIFIW